MEETESEVTPSEASVLKDSGDGEVENTAAAATAAEPTTNGDSETTAPPTAAPPTTAAATTAATFSRPEKTKDNSSDDDDEDDDGEILEESPCGRWLKRREQVKYRDVPGIDTAYLAMDTEEGVEVVWNEAQFSGSKKFKAQEEKLKEVFEVLTHIDHPNIVNFHKFWTDNCTVNEKTGEKKEPRLIFITEYMSSGSLKQFLRKTKKNMRKIQLQSWKRFCIQILSALNYLHTCDPPIVHGNLTCDTIFIQHNGLVRLLLPSHIFVYGCRVKIGSVAPDIIHRNVKTCRENIRNLHILAPEWGDDNAVPDTPVDIYAFGMCALETAALEISTSPSTTATSGGAENGESTGTITEEVIQRTIDSLEDELQKDFIRSCLKTKPEERPTARELLFHPILFEVHSLKLLAAHNLVNSPANINETMTDEAILTHYGKDTVMATVTKANGTVFEYKLSDFPIGEKLEKFMEDVKFGIYPITAFALHPNRSSKPRVTTSSGESERESAKSSDSVSWEPENRSARSFGAHIGPAVPANPETITVFIRLEDHINRQVSCPLNRSDTPEILSNELVFYGFISSRDRDEMVAALTRVFVQRANEVAEYYADRVVAAAGGNPEVSGSDNQNANNARDPLKLHYHYPSPPVEKDSSQDHVDKTVGVSVLTPAVQLLQEGLDMIALQQQQQHQQQQLQQQHQPGHENGMQN